MTGLVDNTFLNSYATWAITICALIPKPQTDNHVTLRAFPQCLNVSIESCTVWEVEISEGS